MSSTKNISVRVMTMEDWDSVATIYKEGIATGFATFETNVPSFNTWDTAHLETCRIVAFDGERILGWAALSPVSSRCVYAGIAEVSVYISASSRGLGVGKLLMEHLIFESEKAGLWTLQSGIFSENIASVQLHKKVGFRYIGKRERVGKTSDGIWKDNLLFERRSKVVGML
ncbi:MAG: phosphinothricin acetyltransferase [Maribacter sp.]|jgi:phosphinothricin acetyltransferase